MKTFKKFKQATVRLLLAGTRYIMESIEAIRPSIEIRLKKKNEISIANEFHRITRGAFKVVTFLVDPEDFRMV